MHWRRDRNAFAELEEVGHTTKRACKMDVIIHQRDDIGVDSPSKISLSSSHGSSCPKGSTSHEIQMEASSVSIPLSLQSTPRTRTRTHSDLGRPNIFSEPMAGSATLIESTVQGWEAKIMDRVSKMTISASRCAASAADPNIPAYLSPSAEVSFTMDDLNVPFARIKQIPTNANTSTHTIFTDTNTITNLPMNTEPVMPQTPVVTSPLRRNKRELISTPILGPVVWDIITTMETPPIRNTEHMVHPRKKSRSSSASPSLFSSPLPAYLRQPKFSPCRTAMYDRRLERLAEQQQQQQKQSLPQSDNGDTTHTLTPTSCTTGTASISSSTTTSPFLPIIDEQQLVSSNLCDNLAYMAQGHTVTNNISPIVYNGLPSSASPPTLNVLWLQPDTSSKRGASGRVSLLRNKRRRYLRMRAMNPVPAHIPNSFNCNKTAKNHIPARSTSNHNPNLKNYSEQEEETPFVPWLSPRANRQEQPLLENGNTNSNNLSPIEQLASQLMLCTPKLPDL